MISRLLLLLFCAAPLAAQGVATPAEPVPAPVPIANGRIIGMVLCGDTRKPARGALVMISPLPGADGTRIGGGREITTRVGLDGTFVAEHLAPGEYGIMTIYPGYLSPFADMMASEMAQAKPEEQRALLTKQGSVTIRGSESENFSVTLVRGAAVSGRVLYSDGSPGAQVTMDLENTATKSKPGDNPQDSVNVGRIMSNLMTQQSLSTDDLGRFRITGLQPGTYRVAAIQSFGRSDLFNGGGGDGGIAMMFGSFADPSAMHFYSGDTLHRKAAKTYELRAGDEITGIEITIPERAFHHVRGRILGTSGKPANSGQLTLTDKSDEAFVYQQSVAGDGSFDFPVVPPGTYTLAVKDASYNPFNPRDGLPANVPKSPPQTIPFSPGTQDVIVKDSDLADLSFTLPELPPVAVVKPDESVD